MGHEVGNRRELHDQSIAIDCNTLIDSHHVVLTDLPDRLPVCAQEIAMLRAFLAREILELLEEPPADVANQQ